MIEPSLISRIEPGLRTPARLARIALDWWLSELTASLPPRAAAWLLGRQQPLTVRMDVTGAAVVEADGQVVVRLADAEDWPSSLADRRVMPVAIEVPRSGVLIRTIELPLAAAQQLQAAMAFEVERQTPFLVEQVLYGGRVVALEAANGRLRAELCVVPRRIAEAALARAERWSLTAAALRVAGDTGVPSFNLLPSGIRRRSAPWRSEPWKGLVLATVLLLACGLVWISWWADATASGLERDVATRREAGKQAEAVKAKLDVALKQNAFLAAKRADPSAVAVVAELSERLPDDTWLSTLTLAGKTLRIEGVSGSVPAMIETLQKAERFGDPRLATALAQEKANGPDRFDLTLTIRRSPP